MFVFSVHFFLNTKHFTGIWIIPYITIPRKKLLKRKIPSHPGWHWLRVSKSMVVVGDHDGGDHAGAHHEHYAVDICA